MKGFPTSRFAVFFTIAGLGCALDLLSKRWIFDRLGVANYQPTVWLIDETFGFTTSLNDGALFSLGPGRVLLFTVLSILAAIGILYWLFISGAAHDLFLTIALGCVMAGIFGNLYDRLGLHGLLWAGDVRHPAGAPVYAVRDWLHFRIEGVIDWPIFNLADSLLLCGVALLVWHTFRTKPVSVDCLRVSAAKAADTNHI